MTLSLFSNRDFKVAMRIPSSLSSSFSVKSPSTTTLLDSAERSNFPGEGGGGTSLHGLYRYVPWNRVWFLEVLDP